MKKLDCWEAWFVAGALAGMAVYFYWDSVFDINYRILRRLRRLLDERGAVRQAESLLREHSRSTTAPLS